MRGRVLSSRIGGRSVVPLRSQKQGTQYRLGCWGPEAVYLRFPLRPPAPLYLSTLLLSLHVRRLHPASHVRIAGRGAVLLTAQVGWVADLSRRLVSLCHLGHVNNRPSCVTKAARACRGTRRSRPLLTNSRRGTTCGPAGIAAILAVLESRSTIAGGGDRPALRAEMWDYSAISSSAVRRAGSSQPDTRAATCDQLGQPHWQRAPAACLKSKTGLGSRAKVPRRGRVAPERPFRIPRRDPRLIRLYQEENR